MVAQGEREKGAHEKSRSNVGPRPFSVSHFSTRPSSHSLPPFQIFTLSRLFLHSFATLVAAPVRETFRARAFSFTRTLQSDVPRQVEQDESLLRPGSPKSCLRSFSQTRKGLPKNTPSAAPQTIMSYHCTSQTFQLREASECRVSESIIHLPAQ